jgi:hypothetical protein
MLKTRPPRLAPRSAANRPGNGATMTPSGSLFDRLEKLGLKCDHISLDQITSATAALACFPMYMVANVHHWTDAQKIRLPVVNLPGPDALREEIEIGKQMASWEIADEHRRVLATLLSSAKPSDRVIYDYALATLKQLLDEAGPALAETLRTGIARMIVAVAYASGDGILGTGEKVSAEERSCIREINAELGLDRTEAGAWLMHHLGARRHRRSGPDASHPHEGIERGSCEDLMERRDTDKVS